MLHQEFAPLANHPLPFACGVGVVLGDEFHDGEEIGLRIRGRARRPGLDSGSKRLRLRGIREPHRRSGNRAGGQSHIEGARHAPARAGGIS